MSGVTQRVYKNDDKREKYVFLNVPFYLGLIFSQYYTTYTIYMSFVEINIIFGHTAIKYHKD